MHCEYRRWMVGCGSFGSLSNLVLCSGNDDAQTTSLGGGANKEIEQEGCWQFLETAPET